MNRIDRLFGILTLLQSKKYVKPEQIADKFEISVRTVYRDIKALGEQGIPVSFEPGKGYFIVAGYFLAPVSFSSEEANALLLMETIVQGFADKSIQKHYSSALGKVKAVMQHRQKEKLENMSQHIRLQLPACFHNNFENLSLLQQAISAKCIILIEYINKQTALSQREVEPIGLIFYALNWHLIAWCHNRQEYRDFRVSRIIKVKLTEMPFRISDHIPLNDYLKLLPVDY